MKCASTTGRLDHDSTVHTPVIRGYQAHNWRTAMDGECAFCGRAGAAARQVFCVDCQVQHKVCPPCAEEAAAEPDTYRLVA